MYGFATLDTNTLLLKAYDTWVDIDQSKFFNYRKTSIWKNVLILRYYVSSVMQNLFNYK